MKTTASARDFGTVVEQFAPLRESPAGRLEVRIIKVSRGEVRLDIRQFVVADTFTGFTRKGISLSIEEWHALLGQREAIEAALEGRGTPTNGRKHRAGAPS